MSADPRTLPHPVQFTRGAAMSDEPCPYCVENNCSGGWRCKCGNCGGKGFVLRPLPDEEQRREVEALVVAALSAEPADDEDIQ